MTDDTIGACIGAKLDALAVELGTTIHTAGRISMTREGFHTPEELQWLRETGARELAEEFLREHKA